MLILSGYTPYPKVPSDTRLPHIIDRLEKQLHKTALGAERSVPYAHEAQPPLADLSAKGYRVIALEQHSTATLLPFFRRNNGKIALLLGEERNGISSDLLQQCDEYIEIPMLGKKESFNVSVAAGIALYQLSIS